MEFSTKPLADLTKFFNNEENMYGGEMYDILNSKILLFYDCYQKVRLPPERSHEGLSIMPKERAARFYYDTLSNRSFDFSTMIARLKTHFGTEEHRQHYLSEWRENTFTRVCANNPTKNKLDCLTILLNKL
jgi:hypothetical protein